MSAVKVPQHLRDAAKKARAAGWEITVTGGSHLRWRSPKGALVFTGLTPGRYGHGPKNERNQLAKAGLA